MIRVRNLIIIVLSFFLLSGNKDLAETVIPSKNYLEMEGVTVTHVLNNSTDSLSDNKIIELQDSRGLTIWFGRYFHKDICITGVCRMVKLWIFWDGAGNYLGIQLDKKNPLTKSDHTPFERQDYIRLDEILSDSASILKDLSYEELTVDKKSTDNTVEIDGYTSATQPTLKEYVIKDAVYTCYTLWHTVYGETQKEIENILQHRMDDEYIQLLLSGENYHQMMALKNIGNNENYYERFEEVVYKKFLSANKSLSNEALSLITPARLGTEKSQIHFVNLVDSVPTRTKYEIIYRLQTVKNISDGTILLLLEKFITGKIDQGALNQIFQLVTPEHLKNENIKRKLVELTKSANPYISNLTKSFLSKRI